MAFHGEMSRGQAKDTVHEVDAVPPVLVTATSMVRPVPQSDTLVNLTPIAPFEVGLVLVV